jgi:phenylalanyl-tRNA synthetase beta chain
VPSRAPTQRPSEALERQVRGLLRGKGYREIYTNSMLSTDRAERFNERPAGSDDGPVVETKNPISEEMAALRPRLLPGALDVMQHNRNHGQEALRFFEIGHVYRRAPSEEASLVPGFDEHPALLLGLSGPHAPTRWDADPREADVFDLKGTVEALLEDLRLPDITMTPRGEDDESAITMHRLDVASGNVPLGTIARIRDDVQDDFDLDAPVFVAEFNWAALVEQASPQLKRSYEAVSRFPVVDRDLAVLVPANQSVGPLQATIRDAGAPLLRRVDVFDVYEGEGIGDDEKSVAFTLRFGADRTLTDEEVDEQIEAIMDALARHHDATLRQ